MFTLRSFLLRSLALALVAAAGASLTATANAQYYTGSVRNNLGITMSYQYQHNGGPWITKTLPPGQSHAFAVPANLATRTVIKIRFDSRLGDGRLTLKTVNLAMIGTNERYQGWRQNFIRVNDRRDVMLAR